MLISTRRREPARFSLYRVALAAEGRLGERTVFADTGDVTHLHLQLNHWSGKDLFLASPCLVVTEKLARTLNNSGLNGCSFEEIETETSHFRRLLPQGSVHIEALSYARWSGHDFCLTQHGDLVLTEEALRLLHSHDFTELTRQD